MTVINIEVGVGELIDKITILEIKQARIKAPEKLKNIEHELKLLNKVKSQLVIGNDSGPTHLLSYCHTKGVAIFNNPRYLESTAIDRRYQTLCEQNLANLSVDSVMEQITVALEHAPENQATLQNTTKNTVG